MTSSSPLERRNCEEILNLKHLWALNREDVEEKENLFELINSKVTEDSLSVYSVFQPKQDPKE